nr:hypothetical protein [Tanacetum cinerariifolium]
MNTSLGIGVSTKSNNTMNEDNPVGVTSVVKEGVTPSVGDMMAEKVNICSLEDTTVPESFPTLTTPVTTTAGNAPGKSSYANITGKSSGKKVNVHTLFTPGGKYGLVRSIFSSSTGLFSFQFSFMDGLDAILENDPWFIRNNLLIMKKWHPDKNILKEDVSTIPVWVKLHGVPVTAFSKDGLSAIATKMELKDNIVVAMPKITREGHYTCNVRVKYEWKPSRCSSCKVFGHIHMECPKNTFVGEKKTVKKPSQTSQGVPKGVEPTIKFSNSNPFNVFNSVDNDEEFGTNGGLLICNTSIGEKIDKIKRQIYEGKLRLLDNDGNPLVPTEGFLPDSDDYDPYDDDIYGNHDLSEHLQSICEHLDITVRGRRKK